MGPHFDDLLDNQTRRRMLILRHSQHGVTLIELMIAIVIFGILLAMGVPAYSGWVQNQQIRTAAESILNGIQLTRAEAVRQNTNVQFSLTALPMSDWQVSVASTAAVIQTRSSQEGSANARVATLPAGATTVTFNGLGRATTNLDSSAPLTEADITSTAASATRQLNILVSGGMVHMCDPALPATNPQSCSF